MDRRSFLKKSICGAAVLGLGCSGFPLASAKKNDKPLNFVFFLIDDLGWADLGCYGSSFHETPNIDQLASEGMKFTDAYAAAPVCSPTRASIMSGKYPARLGLTEWIPGEEEPTEHLQQLPLEEVTVAEVFKDAGYATGYVGKWHLGDDEKFHPVKQGFDSESIRWYYKKSGYRTHFSPEGDYLTDLYTNDAVEFIKEHESKPFMLFLSHYAVHVPIQAPKELISKYEPKAEKLQKTEKESYDFDNLWRTRVVQNNATYAAMVESVDNSVGKVITTLKESGLDKNTAIIFMSDNGGYSTWDKKRGLAPTANFPLREGKGWLYEGGIREPMIIKWPGVVKGGSVCDEPVISTDFYPTMLEMAGLRLKPKQHADGVSLVGLLKGAKSIEKRTLYWHFPHFVVFGNEPSGAVRDGDYKLIEYYEDGRVELYNLNDDIGEREDLSKKEPERADELRKKLHAWLEDVDAKMPTKEGMEKAWKKIEEGTLIHGMAARKKR